MARGRDLGRTQVLLAALCAAAVVVPAATSSSSRLGIELVADGFRHPVQVVAAPGKPDRLYVVERAGRVRVVEDGRVLGRPFLDIRSRVRSGGLIGMLSIAFHPRYGKNGRAFAMYTAPGGVLRVDEVRARAGTARVTRRWLSADIATSLYVHAGGQLAFGPDGRLHVAVGDGLEPASAQDPVSTLGKIWSIAVDGTGGSPRLVALGLRNPWRFSFDRLTGALWIGDVGEDTWEEIDVVRRGRRGAVNFGWGVDTLPTPVQSEAPRVRYAHPGQGCAAVIGGFVYRGRAIPSARGRYFYGDTCSGRVWSVRARVASPTPRLEPFTAAQLASFGEDAAGELYLVLRGNGVVARLVSR
jgi:glucose/arabinose dehydrogenase